MRIAIVAVALAGSLASGLPASADVGACPPARYVHVPARKAAVRPARRVVDAAGPRLFRRSGYVLLGGVEEARPVFVPGDVVRLDPRTGAAVQIMTE